MACAKRDACGEMDAAVAPQRLERTADRRRSQSRRVQLRRIGTRQRQEQIARSRVVTSRQHSDLQWALSHCTGEALMELVKGGLLWLAGVPLPFILLLALFLHPS